MNVSIPLELQIKIWPLFFSNTFFSTLQSHGSSACKQFSTHWRCQKTSTEVNRFFTSDWCQNTGPRFFRLRDRKNVGLYFNINWSWVPLPLKITFFGLNSDTDCTTLQCFELYLRRCSTFHIYYNSMKKIGSHLVEGTSLPGFSDTFFDRLHCTSVYMYIPNRLRGLGFINKKTSKSSYNIVTYKTKHIKSLNRRGTLKKTEIVI